MFLKQITRKKCTHRIINDLLQVRNGRQIIEIYRLFRSILIHKKCKRQKVKNCSVYLSLRLDGPVGCVDGQFVLVLVFDGLLRGLHQVLGGPAHGVTSVLQAEQ